MLTALAIAVCPAPPTERVTCVHDGDTIIIERERMRIVGIDAPELKGGCDAESALAIRSRDRLVEILNERRVSIKRIGYDRFGRTLVEMPEASRKLVDEGLAQVWRGRRAVWC